VWKSGWISSTAVQTILIVVFCTGAVYAIASMLGFLPAGW